MVMTHVWCGPAEAVRRPDVEPPCQSGEAGSVLVASCRSMNANLAL